MVHQVSILGTNSLCSVRVLVWIRVSCFMCLVWFCNRIYPCITVIKLLLLRVVWCCNRFYLNTLLLILESSYCKAVASASTWQVRLRARALLLACMQPLLLVVYTSYYVLVATKCTQQAVLARITASISQKNTQSTQNSTYESHVYWQAISSIRWVLLCTLARKGTSLCGNIFEPSCGHYEVHLFVIICTRY